VLSLEFPHLLRLLEETHFDTIYPEHYAYYSFLAAERILKAHGLRVFDVEELKSHGGSLRISACRVGSRSHKEDPSVDRLRRFEERSGLGEGQIYADFASRLPKIKADFQAFVDAARKQSKSIAGYSAPAKGNTFLNYCGVDSSDIQLVADLNPSKQNHFLPGSRIPIRTPEDLFEAQPDYVLILAWNLRKEISGQLGRVTDWGGQFVTGIPSVEVFGR
jgi:hypothetical protein